MPKFEVEGPDPDGDYWVIRVEMKGAVGSRMSLQESYSTADDARLAADGFNADPESAPTV